MNKRKSLIQRLKDRYDRAEAERAIKAELERPFRERVEAIFTAPRYCTTDFWCNTCKRDCSGTGYRQVCTVREKLPTAWFVGYCPKGHKMVRRITDKDTDPFYDFSEMIQRHRYEMKDAFLTPDDPRFKLLYPLQYKELMKKQTEKK
jgi:hypothetical protein